jgi:hypothetical protein
VTLSGYCVNSGCLRLSSDIYGAAGSVYQIALADFSKVTAYRTDGNGTAHLIVQGRDERALFYGHVDSIRTAEDARAIASAISTVPKRPLGKVAERDEMT